MSRMSAHNSDVSGYTHSTCWSFYTNLPKEDIDYVSCSVYEYGEWKYYDKSIPAMNIYIYIYIYTHTHVQVSCESKVTDKQLVPYR